MSTAHCAYLIYGFMVEGTTFRHEEELTDVYYDEWLLDSGAKHVRLYGAGRTHGGTPKFFIGSDIVTVDDFTRSQPWEAVPWDLEASVQGDPALEVLNAHRRLGEICPEFRSNAPTIGFYLLGEAR